ncbi:MAG: galactokinase [Planctomycetaceae bacterium]|nr:galactokinase [Planctomycetaceae bacterium]
MTPTPDNPESDPRIAREARRLFQERFGSMPVVAHAPGRINLIGEHVDYLDGVVLPMAIDRRAAVAIAASNDGRTTIAAPDLGIEAAWDGPPPRDPIDVPEQRFANHLLGVIAACGGTDRPWSILVTSEIPAGAGVSSSAAIEVAAGAAWSVHSGTDPDDPLRLARDAQQAEHQFVGTPCGIMDMLVSAAAEADAALRIDCRTLEYESVPLPSDDQLAFLLVDSGVSHRLADGGYADRRAACERVVAALGGSLRDTSVEMLDSINVDVVDRRRARHVVDEIARVERAIGMLGRGDLTGLGSVMLEGHASLRDLFEVSVPELDLIVETASKLRDSGCFGARMTGGGFGGAAIVLTDASCVDVVQTAIEEAFLARFDHRPDCFRVRSVEGVRIATDA